MIHGATAMTRFSRPLLLALLLAVGTSAHAATVVPLNDTGQTLCYDGAGATVACTTGADDGRYGRDAANTAGALPKTGGGNAGFDFTKIGIDGSALLPTSIEWYCIRDNVTGLTWELKAPSGGGGLRDSAHTYTWYSANAASNGGNAGDLGTDTCGGTLSAYSNQCNTANYVAAVNATSLCGYTDWRMPSIRELLSLVDFSVPATSGTPTIDATYFPNTQFDYYWAANNFSSLPVNALHIFFADSSINYGPKTNNFYVRLVRGGE